LFYAQHNFPGARFPNRAGWDYVAAALDSSSYLRMNPVMHWLTGNIGYHHVHHLNARIPFYRLPEAMAGIEELQSPGTTSLHPCDIYRCLRLKLWDPERERLVSFQEHREAALRGDRPAAADRSTQREIPQADGEAEGQQADSRQGYDAAPRGNSDQAPLQVVRPGAGGVSQVRHLPDLLPQHGQ
jgi:hypothetical protein